MIIQGLSFFKFLIRQVCKSPINMTSWVFVCLCFYHLFPTFPFDQGGDRKPVFISRLWLIVRAKGHIFHIILPINRYRCDPAIVLRRPYAHGPSQQRVFHHSLHSLFSDIKCLFVFKFLSATSDTFLAENVTPNNRLGADSTRRSC